VSPVKKAQIPVWLAGAAAAATVISIAAFEILLGMALAAVLIQQGAAKGEAKTNWRWPPLTLPLCMWFAGTMLSAAASGDARAALPQLKKFYIYLMLFLVYGLFRTIAQVRWLALAWTLAASLSAMWGFVQLARKYEAAAAAHQNFYLAYVDARITGFMGHWMTFSGHMMIALMLVGTLLFFSPDFSSRGRWTPWMILAGLLIAAALVAAFTRSMWLGAMGGGAYLLWMWRRSMVLAIPAGIALVLLINPFAVRERAVSAFQPHGGVDSNEHRAVTRQIGWEMIKAHPWLGVGPEEVGKQYLNYVPASVQRPLPEGYYGHLHNIYIHYAAERGVPAALALMWALGQALFDFIRGLRRLPAGWRARSEAGWVLHGAIAAMIAVLLSGWYELNLGDSEVLGMVLAVIACGYVALTDSSYVRGSHVHAMGR
jgi:putative inorganic carbon (hco3(-)) transporter